MKKQLLSVTLFLSVLFCSAQNKTGKLEWNYSPYENKVFIENKGQFDNKNGIEGSNIRYGITSLGTEYYFTSTGWTYRHAEAREATGEEIVNTAKANAAARAEGKEENEHRMGGKTVTSYVRMNWVGSNPDAPIVASEPVTEYFNYIDLDVKPGKCTTANAWKKITYLNLYPGIDVEYTFPENKRGIEYALILHPGADPSVIKMLYSEMSGISLDEDGNIKIQTSFGDFIDHAPVTHYEDRSPLESRFELSGNTVSFKLSKPQTSNFKPQTIVIDPWTVDPGPYQNAYDAAYDIEYDNAGNVYVYGGGYEYAETKYNSAGVEQWSTALNFYDMGCGPSGLYSCYGDFAVDASSGASYLVEGFNYDDIDFLNLGARVGKINTAGLLTASWIPGTDDRISEMWRIVFNNCTKQAIIAGGGVSQTYQACLLDTTLTNLTPVNVLSASDPYHDFTLLAIDNYSNCFMATNQRYGEPGVFDNVLLECPSNTSLAPTTYLVSDNHTFVEVSSIPYVNNVTSLANGFNGIAVGNTYLYTYDGGLLQKWNKNNGAFITSRTLSGAKFASGGIDIDDCDSIYLGFGKSVLKLDPTTLNTVSTVQTFANNIYDIKLGPGNMLYVAGRKLVAAISLPVTCGSLNLSQASTPDSCSSKGTATVTVSGGVGPFTYIWSPSGQTTSSITGLTAGSYTVTVTDLAFSPCSRSTGGNQTIVVTVPGGSTLPVMVSPSSPAICNGGSVSLTASGGSTYTWTPSSGLSSTSGATVTANPSSTTIYIVTGNNGSGCTNTASVTVTVNSKPTIGVIPNAPALCTGQSVLLTAFGGNTYTWSPASGLSSTSGTSVTANPSSSATYIVTGTDGNGCTNTASVTVTVNPKPTITVNPTAPVLCNGQSVLLTAGGGNTYSWSPASGLSSTSGTIVTANPSSSSTYVVTGMDGNGCINTASVTVTVNPNPDITVNPTAPVLCNGQSVTLTAGGGATYVWSPSSGLSSGSGTSVSADPSSSTVYTVTGTDGNGCSNTATTSVTVNPLPVINVDPATSSLCIGQSVSLTAGGGSTYIWSPATGLSSTSGATVSADPASSETYIVTGTDGNGCSSTASATITINPLPVVNAGPDQNICPNDSSQLNVTGPPPGSTYTWSPSTNLSCDSCDDPFASPSLSTTYVVSVTTLAGCSNSDTVNVIVTPLSPVAGPDTAVCGGNSVQLFASGGTGYQWTPTTGLSDPNISNPLAFPSATTVYTVTVSSGACNATASVTVTIFPDIPYPTITQSFDTLFCSVNPVYKYYQWYFNSTIISNATDTFYIAPQSGNYNVAVTDSNGCAISVGINIVLNVGLQNISELSGFSLYPNPATNELFIKGYGPAQNGLITIFNMLGEKISSQQSGAGSRKPETVFDVSSLSQGVYFVQFVADNASNIRWIGRFVKE